MWDSTLWWIIVNEMNVNRKHRQKYLIFLDGAIILVSILLSELFTDSIVYREDWFRTQRSGSRVNRPSMAPTVRWNRIRRVWSESRESPLSQLMFMAINRYRCLNTLCLIPRGFVMRIRIYVDKRGGYNDSFLVCRFVGSTVYGVKLPLIA